MDGIVASMENVISGQKFFLFLLFPVFFGSLTLSHKVSMSSSLLMTETNGTKQRLKPHKMS
jgi:hypothetical protein